MAAIDTITNTLTNTPLYTMVEKMGLAIASAQRELDYNSIELLKQLSEKEIDIGGVNYNLITLGFTPTFYAFTEATFEAKLEFSMAESKAFDIGGSISASFGANSNSDDVEADNPEEKKSSGIIAASITASYARKFDQSAEGSSSISARMVSLPPPENLLNILKNLKQ